MVTLLDLRKAKAQETGDSNSLNEAEQAASIATMFAAFYRERGNIWSSKAPEPLIDIARIPELVDRYAVQSEVLARQDLCRDPQNVKSLGALASSLYALRRFREVERLLRYHRILKAPTLEIELQRLCAAFLSGDRSVYESFVTNLPDDDWVNRTVRETSFENWASDVGVEVEEIGATEEQDLRCRRVFNGEIRIIGRRHKLGRFARGTTDPTQQAVVMGPYCRLVNDALMIDHPHGDNMEQLPPWLLARDGRGHALVRTPKNIIVTDRPVLALPAMNNYCHWMIETLPSFLAMRHMLSERPMIVTTNEKHWMKELLDMAGLSADHYVVWTGTPFASNAPVIASSPITELACHSTAIRSVRIQLLERIEHAVRPRKRFFIGRGHLDQRKRLLINEAELIAIAQRYGFEQIFPERMTVAEQIATFAQAEAIVGPSGAAFANMIFAPEGAKIMLMTQIGTEATTFVSIAKTLEQEIIFCSGWPTGPSEFGLVNRNFIVRPEDFEMGLNAVLDTV